MSNLGPFELIVILIIVIIFFGVGRLPELGGAIGKSIREFRNAMESDESKEKKDEETEAISQDK